MPLADLQIPFFAADSVQVLHDEDYLWFLHEQIQAARRSIEVSMFVADVRPERDVFRMVRGLLHALAEAQWRGVQVRVLLSPFVSDVPPLDVNRVAHRFLIARGAHVRRYRSQEQSRREALHSKVVIFDRRVCVTGSHNWTNGALGQNLETSVAVTSEDLAQRMGATFENHWQHGEDHLELI